ncbi:MAG: pilus assembly protein [bacterium]|nr:pilus assembly protein [bacterium]
MQTAAGRGEAQRGQALTETAIILPLFLLLLYGIIWAVQSSVVGERVQLAVRYSGLVSNESSPYQQYSLYALYNNLQGVSAPPSSACVPPSADALLNGGEFPGPTMTLPFFQPSGSPAGSCSQGTASMTGSLLQPEVFTNTQSSITAHAPIQGMLQSVIGSAQQQLDARQNYLDAPGIGTVLGCYPELNAAVSASLEDKAPIAAPSSVAPIPDVNPVTPLLLAGSC